MVEPMQTLVGKVFMIFLLFLLFFFLRELFQVSSLIWFRSLGDVIVLEFCAPGLLFRTRLLSQLDTVVTGEAVFCQISTRQTNVVKYINYILTFADQDESQ